MKEKLMLSIAAAIAFMTTSLLGATYKVGSSDTFTLDGNGELLLTVKGLSKGTAYTFVADTGVADTTVDMEVGFSYYDKDFEEDTLSSISFSDFDERSTTTTRMFVTQDDWVFAGLVKGEDYDPEFDTLYTADGYYLYLTGDAGTKVTVSSQTGIVAETIPLGTSENMDSFGVIGENKPVTKNASFTDEDAYWYTVNLTAGKKYRFTVSGEAFSGTASWYAPEDVAYYDPDYNLGVANDDGTVTYTVKPSATGLYYMEIDGEYNGKFTVVGEVSSGRKIEDHPLAGELTDGSVIEAVAGARNDSQDRYYDEIIDTSLYSVNLKGGNIALFETTFDVNDCTLEIYDSTGSCVGRNFFRNQAGNGQRFSFVPEKGGTYYVGVCRKDLDLEQLATNETPESVSVTGTILYTNCGEYQMEANDMPSSGETVSIVLGDSETDGALQNRPDGMPRIFDATNHVDWFIVGARSGITYNFKAATTEEYYIEERPIQIAIYTMSAKGALSANPVKVFEDAQEPVSFTANADTTYYLKVSMPLGQGCECPYGFYAWVSGENYGFLRVDVKGAENALWNLKGLTGKWGSGAEIIAEAGEYVVQGNNVSGWKKPADQSVTVVAGNVERALVTLKYSDLSDPNDDVMKGAVSIAPAKNKQIEFSRSLWTDDKADFFKMSVDVGTQYDLSLDVREGSPLVTVYRDGKLVNGEFTGQVVAEGTDFAFMAMEKGTYYVVVTRSSEAADIDAAYTLKASACKVGYVKTDKTAYKVGEKAGYLTVKFSRTTKEGRVRVRYTTVEGTAKANVNYVPQTGEIEWADGDSKAREIKIKLIPDLIDSWAEDRTFTIRIDAVNDEDFDPTAEYRPLLTANEVEVAITDSSKAASGTVQICAYGESMNAFENPKKPALAVAAGEDAVLWVSRNDGADKIVGVKATVTAKQTAGQEYVVVEEQEIWWNDGDADTKELRIFTMRPTSEYFANKTFTVKLAAIASSDGKAKVQNATATVTVFDGDCSMSFADYAKSFTKESGVTAKEAKAGTWYFDAVGALCNVEPDKKGGNAQLTYSVTGPGRLRFAPALVDNGGIECKITSGRQTVESKLDGSVVEMYLGSGKTDIKIEVKRTSADATYSYLSLAPMDGGVPFQWEKLEMPQLVTPAVSAQVVDPAHVIWKWTSCGNENVRYRFSCDIDKKKLGTANAEILPQTFDGLLDSPMFENCPDCGDPELALGKTYSWRVDSVLLDDNGDVKLVHTNKSVWTFKVATAGAPITSLASGDWGVDATGEKISDLLKAGEPISVIQGVAVTNIQFGADTEGVTYALVSGSKLPTGLKLDAKTGALVGAPQKTGDYPVVVQAMSGKIAGAAVDFVLRVNPINLAAGTFNGLLRSDDAEVSELDGMQNILLASLNVTVKDSGQISANVKAGPQSFTFSASSYDAQSSVAGELPMVTVNMAMKPVKLLNAMYTNTLSLAVCQADSSEWAALDTPMSAEMTIFSLSPDKKSVVSNIVYTGKAYRDNTKIAEVLEAQIPYCGYYTVSLPVENYGNDGAPKGNGYLTLTLDKKGKAKITGVLADGTKVTGSAVTGYVSDDGTGSSSAYLPVYVAAKTVSMGGWVKLRLSNDATVDGVDITGGNPVPVVDTDASVLQWINADKHAAYADGEWSSYVVELNPVGGFYSTVVNLQTYYKNYAIELVSLDENGQLPDEMLGEAFEWSGVPGMVIDSQTGECRGFSLDVSVNSVTAEKNSLVYTTDAAGKKTKFIDWENSVNPCKFTFNFKSATGIFSGGFDLWASEFNESGEEISQKKIGSYKHEGVLLMTRSEESVNLPVEDAVFSGFYTAPGSYLDSSDNKKYKWNASYLLQFGASLIETPPAEGWED